MPPETGAGWSSAAQTFRTLIRRSLRFARRCRDQTPPHRVRRRRADEEVVRPAYDDPIYCDQVPASTSIFQVVLYVGSEILMALNTSGWNT